MLTDVPNNIVSAADLSSKAIIKYPTTPQTCRYTTSWNINVRKTEINNLKYVWMINDTPQRS